MDLLSLTIDPTKLKFTRQPRMPPPQPPQPPPSPKPPRPDIIIEVVEQPHQELKPLYIPYAIFLFAIGTCNILTLDSELNIDTSLVCSLLSPLPTAALYGSAITAPYPYLNILTASLIPALCQLWSPLFFAPYAILLAITILISSKRSPVVYATCALLMPSITLIFLPSAPQKYGVTLTFTILAVLCMMTTSKISYKVKQVF